MGTNGLGVRLVAARMALARILKSFTFRFPSFFFLVFRSEFDQVPSSRYTGWFLAMETAIQSACECAKCLAFEAK